MDVLVSILWYAVPSAALFLLIAALVAGPRMARRPRYRVGQPWPHEPLWWTANPAGAQLPAVHDDHAGADSHSGVAARSAGGTRVSTERGGARGSW